MGDFDSKGEATSPGRPAPNISFRENMLGIQTRFKQLVRSIDDHDLEAVEHTARSATSHWIAGYHACRRLVATNNTASLYVQTACELLEANYVRLLELLDCATATIKVPRLHGGIARLRAQLVATMAEPLGTAERAAITTLPPRSSHSP
jgi:hypothetical protein